MRHLEQVTYTLSYRKQGTRITAVVSS